MIKVLKKGLAKPGLYLTKSFLRKGRLLQNYSRISKFKKTVYYCVID